MGENEDAKILWDALGVEPEVSDCLAFTLEYRWVAATERIQVTQACGENGADAVGSVTAVLLRAWRIVQFCGSRWLTIGVSGRSMVVGMLTGLECLVKCILATPHESSPFLNGYPRNLPTCKKFLVVSGVVSRVSDAILVLLLEDGRVALQVLLVCSPPTPFKSIVTPCDAS